MAVEKSVKNKERFAFAGVTCAMGGTSLPVANLSLGGFFVATEQLLQQGQVVSVSLDFPGGRGIPVVGKVAWVNHVSASRHPGLPTGLGIAITKIAMADKLALVYLVRRLRTQAAANGPAGPTTPA